MTPIDRDPVSKRDFALVQIGLLRLVLAGEAEPDELAAPPLPDLDLYDDHEGDR